MMAGIRVQSRLLKKGEKRASEHTPTIINNKRAPAKREREKNNRGVRAREKNI